MDLLFAFFVFLAGISACLWSGRNLIYGMLFGLLCFGAVGKRRGHSLGELAQMSWKGCRTSFPVIRVLVVIGCLTALWRVCGTIAFFVYYGIQMITPHFFILTAFVLTAVLSFGIGTSFGVAGTAGVVLMILARSGGVHTAMTAGAIMSGAYFGERCSPASSSALFAVTLSGADGRKNLQRMFKTSILPVVITLAVYGFLSWKNPLLTMDTSILDTMRMEFSLSGLTLAPAVVLLGLALSGVPVFYAVAASALTAGAVAVALQGKSFFEVLKWAVFGYAPELEALSAAFSGGGILSMKNVLLIVLISSAYSGIFRETGMLEGIQEKMVSLAAHTGRFGAQVLLAVCSGSLFCNQTIGIILADQMLGGLYEDPQERAADICNSIVLIAGLIPWSIAATGPLAMLGAGTEALPYSLLLYLVPLTCLAAKAAAGAASKRRRFAS